MNKKASFYIRFVLLVGWLLPIGACETYIQDNDTDTLDNFDYRTGNQALAQLETEQSVTTNAI